MVIAQASNLRAIQSQMFAGSDLISLWFWQTRPHGMQALFQRARLQTREHTSEGIVVGNAVVEADAQQGTQGRRSKRLAEVLDILEPLRSRAEGSKAQE